MKITCIATGSSGNCFSLEGNYGTRVLLDAGARAEAIKRLGIPLANTAVFVTHEHGDHAASAEKLQADYGAEIWTTDGTANALGLKRFTPVPPFSRLPAFGEHLGVGIENARAIPVLHGAADPAAFYFDLDGEGVIYLADAGQPPEIPGGLHPKVLILEANYTPERLEAQADKGRSELYVAGRVSSGIGHLSANQTAELAEPFLDGASLVILFHQSRGNFDLEEYENDETISAQFKALADFAKPNKTWNTVPF